VARVDEETGQTIVSGMGELHLEVLRDKMLREYNLSIRVHKPRVSYRETIREAVVVTGEFSRQQQGVSQFARVKIRVEPFDGEESLSFQSKLKPNAVPADFSELLQRAVKDEAQGGGIVGYPLMKLRFTLLDAEYRDGETTELAAQAATADAVRKCITEERAVLLEPIMKLEIVTPDEFMGAIQADLNARRALIISSQLRGKRTVLEVEAPLRQMFGYSTQIRSLSQGRASFSMEPLRYAEAPRQVLDEILG
jgi:elongation factor G